MPRCSPAPALCQTLSTEKKTPKLQFCVWIPRHRRGQEAWGHILRVCSGPRGLAGPRRRSCGFQALAHQARAHQPSSPSSGSPRRSGDFKSSDCGTGAKYSVEQGEVWKPLCCHPIAQGRAAQKSPGHGPGACEATAKCAAPGLWHLFPFNFPLLLAKTYIPRKGA